MKVTLAYSPGQKPASFETITRVAEILKRTKHKFNSDVTKNITSAQGASKLYESLKSKVKNSDALIVEATNQSIEVGYVIAEALAQRKPVLALVDKKSKTSVDSFLSGKLSKFVMTKRYTPGNLEDAVNSFISFANRKVDTKFILIITPEIDAYLRWKAKEEGVRKAEVVRKAVDDYIKRDNQYKPD